MMYLSRLLKEVKELGLYQHEIIVSSATPAKDANLCPGI